MKIKQGKEGIYKEFLQKNNKTLEKRMDVRFLMQWIAIIELDMQNGIEFEHSAGERYRELKKTQSINIPLYLNDLAAFWEYGEKLKEWYNKNGCNKKQKKEMSSMGISLSSHARKRMHSRCGLSKKAQDHVALRAYKEGLTCNDVSGNLRAYFTKVMDHTENKEITELKLFHDKIFIFKMMQNGPLLITVMHAPQECIKGIKSLSA